MPRLFPGTSKLFSHPGRAPKVDCEIANEVDASGSVICGLSKIGRHFENLTPTTLDTIWSTGLGEQCVKPRVIRWIKEQDWDCPVAWAFSSPSATRVRLKARLN
jgi:hypothetical protein